MVSRLCGSGYTRLGDDDVVWAEIDVMADLDEVVYLGSASDARRLKAAAVNCRVGSNFDIVFHCDIADLVQLDMATLFIGCITEAAGADHGARL